MGSDPTSSCDCRRRWDAALGRFGGGNWNGEREFVRIIFSFCPAARSGSAQRQKYAIIFALKEKESEIYNEDRRAV